MKNSNAKRLYEMATEVVFLIARYCSSVEDYISLKKMLQAPDMKNNPDSTSARGTMNIIS